MVRGHGPGGTVGPVTYVIAEPCVDVLDRSCVEECPVEAIYYEDDVPEQRSEYVRANAEFFAPLGSPGGASKVGRIYRDVGPAARIRPRTAGTEPAAGAP